MCRQVHHGKTQVWNRGRICPDGVEISTRAAKILTDGRRGVSGSGEESPRVASSHWKSGICVGPVERQIQRATIIAPTGSSCSRVALSLVAAPFQRRHEGQFLVAHGETRFTAQFAEQHDDNVCQCLASVLGIPTRYTQPAVVVSMLSKKSGLGLGSAVGSRVNLVNKKDPVVAQRMVEGMQHGPTACFSSCPVLSTVVGRRCVRAPGLQ